MPNGHCEDPSIDLFVLKQSSRGQPRFHTEKGEGGVLSIHTVAYGSYSFEPRWEAVPLRPLVSQRLEQITRAKADAIAADLVEMLKALLASNPDSHQRPELASAFLAIQGWCVVLGDYHFYKREKGGYFERVEPPLGRGPDEIMQLIEQRPELDVLVRNTHVTAERGLTMHEPSACVIDLVSMREWIATTLPLHKLDSWNEIRQAPLDDREANGYLFCAAREYALMHSTDLIVIRGRAPQQVGPKAVPVPENDEIVGELKTVWGSETGRPYGVRAECLIGRGKDCDIVLDDDGVSRHHARVTRVDGRLLLCDLGSVNGIMVNGVNADKHALADGDIVQIGAHRFRFSTGQTTIWEPHVAKWNERALLTALAQEAPLAKAKEHEVSLLLFDLDHFHRLNAKWGYPVGDAILTHVEYVVRGRLRAEDTLSRIGGEEFGVVLRGLGLEEARAVAEELRRAVNATSYLHEGQEVHVTISCGVAAWSSSTMRPWELLRAAEGRLHDAKASGRNRVC